MTLQKIKKQFNKIKLNKYNQNNNINKKTIFLKDYLFNKKKY